VEAEMKRLLAEEITALKARIQLFLDRKGRLPGD
jgi:hypothetical protein